MNSFEKIVELVMPGCYMANIDLKDDYFTVPIASQDRKYWNIVSVLLPALWFFSSTKNFHQNNEAPNGSFETDGTLIT